MKNNLALPDSIKLSGKLSPFAAECWSHDSTTFDTDYFIKTLSAIQAKGARPELIGSIITHYASKYLPDLSENHPDEESVATSWARKKLFIETLVGIFPPDRNSIPCSFLLRALRVANMVGVGPTYRAELEKRVSWQLDRAELEELMIPGFSHTVKGFVSSEDAARSGAALMKVSKLVDGYLAEAAVDAHLGLSEFVELASVLPSHARSVDDGLYRAIDTYLKAHPALSKQDRKRVFNLIDSRKLSTDASLHAAQNERLPVRAVIQVLLSEQNKLSKHIDWSGSLRSPVIGLDGPTPTRCLSKREVNTPQRMEIRRLKEDVLRLQSQCMKMEKQIEKLLEKKKGFFSWKRIWNSSV
ncbi:BTB/POZ domain-containing protein at5g48800 [Phtheirospermum japonicum]|uniref:BTB/POZ domain-containing protein at5g48800 n=1 Tax=Phtheirospermum japonicum TaxID=374723 RepID=A0A830CP07_9LAMI|nr:BTB/POZ domain-containing protein at5g48800 [Phtheirospermum japonicum]